LTKIFEKSMKYYFLLLQFVALMQITAMASGHKVDSLLHVLDQIQEGGSKSELIKIHMELGNQFSSKSEEKYDKSIHHNDRAAEIALEEENYTAASEAIFYSGVSHKRKNNYPKALEQFYRVVEFDKDIVDQLLIANTYSQISAIYQVLGDYEKAFENQMQGLLIFEVNKDSIGIANSHYNIGSIFFFQLQYEKALESYQKTKEICDALKNENFIYSSLAAIGAVYAKLGRHAESLEYNRSKKICEGGSLLPRSHSIKN